MSSASISFEHTDFEGTPSIVVPMVTRIVDEFKPKAQASGSRYHHYTGPIIMSKLTQKQLDRVRETYKIPDNFEDRLPSPGYTVKDVGDGEVAFYPFLFKLGVRLPLYPFFCQFITFSRIFPTQLTPN